MRRENRERAHGPYPHYRRWRVYLVAANGSRRYRTFETERDARDYLEAWNQETDSRTVSQAITGYIEHLRAHGRATTTVRTTEHRLIALLYVIDRDRSLRSLTPAVGAALAKKRAAVTKPDTQAGELAAARGFASWCISQGWLRRDPFEGLEPIGARARGKNQLRIEEARKYLDAAIADGSPAAIAATLPLLCGMRASEITDRVVRDVDDGARVIWIERAKTRAGDRRLELPEVIRPAMAELVAGRSGGEPLWGEVDRHWIGYHVRRLCRAAGVPIVCPHGLRGTWSSLAIAESPVEHVSRALGHAGSAITRRHYLAEGAEQIGQQRAALRVLRGGALADAGNSAVESVAAAVNG